MEYEYYCVKCRWTTHLIIRCQNWLCVNCGLTFNCGPIYKNQVFLNCKVFDYYIQEFLDTCEDNYTIFNNLSLLINFAIMTQNKPNSIEVLSIRLKIRLELFKRVPSATNMLLAYNLIEEITLKSFAEGKDITTEVNKLIERFDKCKSLALGTKFINERKVAFDRSLDAFKKLTNVII